MVLTDGETHLESAMEMNPPNSEAGLGLVGEFARRMYSDAESLSGQRQAQGALPSDVLGELVGLNDPLDEQAVGRAVIAAFEQAGDIAALPSPTVPNLATTRRQSWFGVTTFTWIRNVGFIVLLFVAWQLWGTSIAQHHAQGQLRSRFDAIVHLHSPGHGSNKQTTLLPAGAAIVVPPEGSGIARIQLPALGVDQIVVAGTSTSDLAKGPGYYVGTAFPGQEGNVAIAGHRTTDGAPFNRLGKLVIGDRIVLTTTSGESFTYRVSQPPVAVSPNDVAVLNNFGDNRVTLTTCTPEFSASQRLIVVGTFEGGSVAATPSRTVPLTPYHIVDSGTASWNVGVIPLVVIELGLLIGLGLLCRRIRNWIGRLGQWALLVPLWGLGLYVLFQSLTSLLPPSV